MEGTKTREHQWVEMRVTPVLLVPDPEGGTPTPIHDIARGEEEIVYGCAVCNMGRDEGMTLPCPGQDLFQEET